MKEIHGFTLVEVLVALALFALLGIGAYRLLDASIVASAHVTASQQFNDSLRMGMWRMEKDLLQVINRPIRDNYDIIEPAFSGNQDGFIFTRAGWGNPWSYSRSELQRVEYYFSGYGLLNRKIWPVLDRAQDTEPLIQNLIKPVSRIRFHYLDMNEEWLEQWPPVNVDPLVVNPIPQAVEVEIEIPGAGEYRRLFLTTALKGIENEPLSP